jgi:methyl-accepting chemotaxis protein
MKRFINLKIATKLIIGFIIISIIAAVVGGIGIVNIRNINSLDTKMYENTVMPMQNLSIVLQTYHRIRANLRDMALSSDSEYRLTTTDKIKERESTLFENLALVAENIRDDKLLDSYNSLNDLLNGKYKEYQDSVINLLNTNQDKQALELIYGD